MPLSEFKHDGISCIFCHYRMDMDHCVESLGRKLIH